MIGTIVDWATAERAGKSSYLIPLGVIYLVPVIISVSMFFIPESPRWLMLQGLYDAGRRALEWRRPPSSSVEAELNEIRAALDRESELGHSVGIADIIGNPVDRRRTVLSICSVTLQAASGSMYIIGASSEVSPFSLCFAGRLSLTRGLQHTKPTSSGWPR